MKQSFLSSALSMFGRGKKEERCAAVDAAKETKVYFEEGGTKYHTNAHCSGMRKPQYIPLSVAKKRGLSPCKKCAPYGVAPTVRPNKPPGISPLSQRFALRQHFLLRQAITKKRQPNKPAGPRTARHISSQPAFRPAANISSRGRP